ncbi:hypothetical protein D3C81_1528930 [compost metagenome]
MFGGNIDGSIGKTGKVHTGFSFVLQAVGQGAVLQLINIAVIGETLVLPKALNDVEEFAGALVAQVMFQEVAVGPLTGRVATGDDVPLQATATEVLQDRCLLRGVGRQGPGGLESDEEFDAAGFPGEGRCGDPGLWAGGQQGAFETSQFGGFRDLGDVVDVGEIIRLTIGQAPWCDVAGTIMRIAAVVFVGGQLWTIGAQRQAPEKFSAHGVLLIQLPVASRRCEDVLWG